jgi:toxin-antitoxin system PIN domain toxin
VGLPWPSLLAFIRIVTNPLAVRQPVPAPVAWRQVADWLSSPVAWIPLPTDRHAAVLSGFLQEPWMTSRLIPDAHLASLAIEHGLTLCSTDGDFARFGGLVWHNPLAAE